MSMKKRNDDLLPMDEETPNSINKHKSHLSSLYENHSSEYPCDQCSESLASRFKYHTIPKLKLRDTVWISTNNNKNFLILCYTELGRQSDGILDELRRAEIGIQSGTQVFIVPISCGLGILKVVNKQKTSEDQKSEIDGDEGVDRFDRRLTIFR